MEQSSVDELVQAQMAQQRFGFARGLRLLMLVVGFGLAIVMFVGWFFSPEYIQLLLVSMIFLTMGIIGAISPRLQQQGQETVGYW